MSTLFISHGSPMHALDAGAVGTAWRALAQRLPRPQAVLIASAHWESEWPMLTTSARPETVHDFGGFPAPLYDIRYPAPGAVAVAERAVALLREAGLTANGNGCRGLDHGAWVPMLHMYPQADLPVAQISLQTELGSAHALRVGRALAPLAHENVLVIGSGHMTHNLREWIATARAQRMKPTMTAPQPYVTQFRDAVDRALRSHDEETLTHWLSLPHARRAHPSDEHWLPLPFAYGAAGPQPAVEHLDLGVDSGVLAMDAYLFTPSSAH